MDNRIQKLMQALDIDKYPLCIEKSRLLTQSYKTTEREPQVLRPAKALAHVLDNITIFIEDHELIVGNSASKPMGLESGFSAGLWSDDTVTFDTCLGGKHIPTGVSISAQCVSAMRGQDIHGPTAVLNSAMKTDQVDFKAALLNMKFHPSSLETEADLRKLSFLIRTYFSQNGKHIQFNVVNEETLRDAQKKPEHHKDLLVRIAGYSAHFIQQGEPMQEEIIKRTAHEKV
jgi:pyruvate-formate lyase